MCYNINMEKILLQDSALIGVGCHKKCYRHPNDSDKCIEVIYNEEGLKDISREMQYRKYMIDHPEFDYSMLPQYFGECETNFGRGYVYELIVQHDGSICPTFRDYFSNPERLEKEFDDLVTKMRTLKQDMLANEIITMNITEENIVIQNSGDKIEIRLLSDLGSSFFLPIDYWFRFVRIRRIERHWKKMCDKFSKLFTNPVVAKFVEAIR